MAQLYIKEVKMKSSILLTLLLALMVIPMANAEVIFKQNDMADLKVPCYNETYAFCSGAALCNLTVIYPNGSVMVMGKAMTNQLVYHNYTLPESNTIGEYLGIMECFDDGKNGITSFNFKITNTGFSYNAGDISLIIAIVITFLLIGMSVLMDNVYLATLGGFASFIVGLFLYIQGFGGMRNLLSEGIGMIMVGIGGIFVFWSIREATSPEED
jgi:hypothetical protein